MKVLSYKLLPSVLCLIIWASCSQISAQNLVYAESFGSCVMPEGWESEVLAGTADYEVKRVIREDPIYGDKCVLSLLDNNKRGDIAEINLYSPWIQPLDIEEFFIDFQLLFIKVDSRPQVLEIYYQQGGEEHLFERYDSSEWGATFNDFADKTIEIDNSSNEPVRLVVKFMNNGWSDAAVTMDNVIFRGKTSNECEEAIEVVLDRPRCYEGNNRGLSDGRLHPSCDGIQAQRPVWYRFIAPSSGIARVRTQANFNDVIDVYYGLCGNLTPFRCTNRDEHGFKGEDFTFPMTQDIVYFIRIGGYDEPYSGFVGDFCLRIEALSEVPETPDNDFCQGALEVKLDENCVESDNFRAGMDGPLPSLNTKSKADVWFKYIHTEDYPVDIVTNADFADVITVYSGSCLFLTEVVGTDQGPVLENIELAEGQKYFIQVSGYFSTLEGNLCVGVEKNTNAPTDNNDCFEARSLTMNDQRCQSGSTQSADVSGIRPTCKVKPGADIWYSFTTTSTTDYKLEVNADFRYVVALYTGECDSLIESRCMVNPHRCEGYVDITGLLPNTTYYIQVSSEVDALGQSTGEVCMGIFEDGQEPPLNVLSLQADVECVGGQVGVLNVNLSGGEPPLELLGNEDGDIILFGESYLVIADDDSGCRQIVEGFGNCNDAVDCDQSDLALEVTGDCVLDRFGLPTGRMMISVAATGGIGNLTFYGHTDGDIIEAGESAVVAVKDDSECLRMFELVNSCDPFDCQQSDLALNVTVNCIDSLLRAQLEIDARDGIGMYTYYGNQDGELLEEGDPYLCIVEDEKGCRDSISGIIACSFDSCAYSGLSVQVSLDCIRDNQGMPTGEAILRINTAGGVGQLNISGGTSGDTLNHGDTYRIAVMDEWGCQAFAEGEVNCAPTSTFDVGVLSLLAVYPNPTQWYTELAIHSEFSGDLEISLVSIDGKTVFSQEEQIQSGRNAIPLIIGQVPSGVYQIRLSMGEYVSQKTIVIRQ